MGRKTRMRWYQPRRREPIKIVRQARRRDWQRRWIGTSKTGAGGQRVHRRRVPAIAMAKTIWIQYLQCITIKKTVITFHRKSVRLPQSINSKVAFAQWST